ncbi:MAG TPA: DUF5110 domain-containing protein, partial [Vicinamibacterales bacterium]|nr:DUF5110 domain-containing protein [Vicinamibacterales bacterium]
VVPPLVFYYPDDANVADIGDEKLVGRDLLVATSSANGETERDVYLPAGTWVDFHSNQWIDSGGEWLRAVPLRAGGIFQLPLYARAGAIIPEMLVDDITLNALGKRADGSIRDDLIVRVFADETLTSFTLYEDDGQTVAYQNGALRTTELSQKRHGSQVTVSIEPAVGSYDGAPTSRHFQVEVVIRDANATAVDVNGVVLERQPSQDAFDAAEKGWFNDGNGLVAAKSGPLSVSLRKRFTVQLASPTN